MPVTKEDICDDAFKVIGIYAKYRQGQARPPERVICIMIDDAVRHAIQATKETEANHAFFVAFKVFFDATNPFRPH